MVISNKNDTAIKIVVKGYVQGVGFRYFIARAANELGLNGYVKNLFTGDVEIYAEGRKEFLEDLAKKAKLGPSHSHVDSIKIEWLEFKNKYNNFEIR
ncbi:MAG: acylphosphatase [Ignavibacteriae bacterium]|nr:MAG: acylphosphatase [Ignavibacteriota bacterium]